MVLKNKFYNIDFNKNINITDNNNNLISKIDETIKNFSGLKILNDEKLLEESINTANYFSKNKKHFLVFGTGGSNLGAKAIIDGLQKNNITIDFFDNIDPVRFQNKINNLDLTKLGFIIISKSGSTPETLSQYLSLIEIFDQKNMKDLLFNNSLIITEDKASPLTNIANKNNIHMINHSKDIGGRYSIFSNVGMIPAVIAGLNVKAIHAGALEQIKNSNSEDFIKIARFFKFQNIIKDLSSSVVMTYSDSLLYFGKWYLQLWAESIGKDQKGITPIHSVGTTDQHSQLQLYLDGPRDKFFTFITTDHADKGFKLNNEIIKENNIDYLFDKKMGDLMEAEQRATVDTFVQNKIPCREIYLSIIDEYSIGKLLAFSIQETIATCLYFEVNPFNQPAVEQGKILTKKYLV
ncbi:hypothetical protein OAJ89_02120 [Alphaproteobacteria bacterium]|nr:hypothetical protein [Alphaproteobacteria bacterium]